MPNTNPHLLDKLTPFVQGAIWLGNGELTTSMIGFTEFNYIFDGLLSQTISHYSKDEKKIPLSLFTTSFGKKFFLHYFPELNRFPEELIDQKDENRNKVLIINSNPETKLSSKDFQTKYPGINFEIVDLI